MQETVKGEVHPLVTITKINPDEIPDIPQNKFLFRGTERKDKENAPIKETKGGKERDQSNPRSDRTPGRERDRDQWDANRRRKHRNRGRTKSGRVIKGRGVFRYRTPSRSRSRSFTPPHWKQAQNRTITFTEYTVCFNSKEVFLTLEYIVIFFFYSSDA